MAGHVVLLSGGLDSTVMLHKVIKDFPGDPVHAISLVYNQRHAKKELKCAKYWVKKFGISHSIVDVSFLGNFIGNASTLVKNADALPSDMEYTGGVVPDTYVPFRNPMFITMAACFAESNGYDYVWLAAHKGDNNVDGAVYWDCSKEFIEKMNATFVVNNNKQIVVMAPFLDMTKAQIVSLGVKLKVNFGKTWSCYKGDKVHCGVCGTCRDRIAAFISNGKKVFKKDRVSYEADPYADLREKDKSETVEVVQVSQETERDGIPR